VDTPEHSQAKPTVAGGKTRVALLATALVALTVASCGESTKRAAASTANAAVTPPARTVTGAPRTKARVASATHAGATDTTDTPSAAHNRTSARRPHHASGSALASLGSAKPAPKLTSAQRSELTVADIALSSPAIQAGSGGVIARQYTCDGADHSPPLHWGKVPAGTAEIAIFLISTEPIAGRLFYGWSIAGINPELNHLQAGQVPAGATLGRNGNGEASYTLCPAPGKKETYIFALYALPRTLGPTPGFNPATLRMEALKSAGHAGILAATYQHT
jgi:phosphatidylethanolamine-binding protein (PEBP) family uncharacterized protein